MFCYIFLYQMLDSITAPRLCIIEGLMGNKQNNGFIQMQDFFLSLRMKDFEVFGFFISDT